MKRFAMSAALITVMAAPAFANPSIASILGIDADDYTAQELVQLNSAYEDGDQTTIDFILSGENREEATAMEDGQFVEHAESNNDETMAEAIAENSTMTGDAQEIADEAVCDHAEMNDNETLADASCANDS